MKLLLSVNYSFNVVKIAANKDSITVSVNVCIYGYVSLLAPECTVCLWVCVCVCECDIKLKHQSKPHYFSDLNKLVKLLHKTHIKVLRLDMCRSIISLTKITHQMWRDHPFSQRNKTTERAVRLGAGGSKEREGELSKIWKRGEGTWLGNIWGGFVK